MNTVAKLTGPWTTRLQSPEKITHRNNKWPAMLMTMNGTNSCSSNLLVAGTTRPLTVISPSVPVGQDRKPHERPEADDRGLHPIQHQDLKVSHCQYRTP